MFAPGQLIDGKYRIGRMIGQGGMGAVYEAEAVLLHRRVAIKVQTLSQGSVAQTSGEMAMRFQLEAQAAGRIGSRHIVDVIDLGRLESGEHFMVMEYLDGQSLRDRIDARGGMTPEALLPIALQLLAGVSAAHAAGIVRRDLKPENVFLVRQADGSDFMKILDFGISKFNDTRGNQGGKFSLTRTGALMGTPRYLSPEQAMGGRAVDQRTDIYMVGVILYECLTGVVPYGANTFNELLFQIVQEIPNGTRPATERKRGEVVVAQRQRGRRCPERGAAAGAQQVAVGGRGGRGGGRRRRGRGVPTATPVRRSRPDCACSSGAARRDHRHAEPRRSWGRAATGRARRIFGSQRGCHRGPRRSRDRRGSA